MSLRRFTEGGIPDQIRDNAVVVFEDFTDEYAAGPVTGTSPWISTLLASGTSTTSTNVLGGNIILSGAATTDNSGAQIQTDIEMFQLQAGKDAVFACRVQLSEATDNHFFAGFGVTDTTFMDGGDGTAALVHSSSLGFFKPDDAAVLYVVAVSGSAVVGQTAVLTMTAATNYLLEFRVAMDPVTANKGVIWAFVNGGLVAGPFTFTSLPSVTMGLTAAQVSGSATGTITATLDYIGAAVER